MLLLSENILRVGFVLEGVEKESSFSLKVEFWSAKLEKSCRLHSGVEVMLEILKPSLLWFRWLALLSFKQKVQGVFVFFLRSRARVLAGGA